MASRDYLPSYAAYRGDSSLGAQCEMFLLTKAIPDILAEDPGTADHAARLAWASAIEGDRTALALVVQRLKLKAIQNSTIRAAVAAGDPAEDSDVEFVGLVALADLVALGA